MRVVMVAGDGGSLLVVACTFHSAGTRTAAVGLSMNEGCGGRAHGQSVSPLAQCTAQHSLSRHADSLNIVGFRVGCAHLVPLRERFQMIYAVYLSAVNSPRHGL